MIYMMYVKVSNPWLRTCARNVPTQASPRIFLIEWNMQQWSNARTVTWFCPRSSFSFTQLAEDTKRENQRCLKRRAIWGVRKKFKPTKNPKLVFNWVGFSKLHLKSCKSLYSCSKFETLVVLLEQRSWFVQISLFLMLTRLESSFKMYICSICCREIHDSRRERRDSTGSELMIVHCMGCFRSFHMTCLYNVAKYKDLPFKMEPEQQTKDVHQFVRSFVCQFCNFFHERAFTLQSEEMMPYKAQIFYRLTESLSLWVSHTRLHLLYLDQSATVPIF